ncbi:hypothetical protein D3C72_2111180 [compost metagenome]
MPDPCVCKEERLAGFLENRVQCKVIELVVLLIGVHLLFAENLTLRHDRVDGHWASVMSALRCKNRLLEGKPVESGK